MKPEISKQNPSIGRIVHVHRAEGWRAKDDPNRRRPEPRAGLVVNCFGGNPCNVKVQLDTGNDALNQPGLSDDAIAFSVPVYDALTPEQRKELTGVWCEWPPRV